LSNDRQLEAPEMAARLAAAIAAGIAPRSAPGELSRPELTEAAELAAKRYQHANWRAGGRHGR
jgi:hypothetical protein